MSIKNIDLTILRDQREYPAVSILVGTHRTMPHREKDPIVVKQLVAEAQDRLKKEFSVAELKPIFDNLDAVVKEIDFDHMLDGLVIFVNKHIKCLYKLPIHLNNKVVIDSTFIVRDVLRALHRMQHYWVLMLSEKATRLYKGFGDTLDEIIQKGLDENGNQQDGFPYSYLPSDVKSEHELLGDHLHRDAKHVDDHKKKYFERINVLLHSCIAQNNYPVILIGTENNCSVFKDVMKHCTLLDTIYGDYSHTPSVHVIKELVLPILEQNSLRLSKKKIADFVEAIGKMRHAIGIHAIWRVAQDGRVHELLVEEDFSVAGIVNPENLDNLIVYEDPKTAGISDDLVDNLIELVLDKGGSVTFCPQGSLKEYDHIAAILRY